MTAALCCGLTAAPREVRAQSTTTSGSNAAPIAAWAQGEIVNYVPVGASDKPIALTFDDGPQPGNTEAILRVLAQNNVRATFFVMGSHVGEFPALLRATRDAGHAIGNHTWSHLEAPSDAVGEVQKTDALIQSTLGGPTALFRPPFGNMDNGVAAQALAQKDAVILWSSDPKDWSMPGTDIIVRDVLAQATPGGIVLMHDGGGDRSQTIAALPTIIRELRARGYRFLTVPELLMARSGEIGDGLQASYFNNKDFTSPVISRLDAQVNFDWGKRAPLSNMGSDSFSARWTGQVKAQYSETHTFIVRADDGVRLWVDNKLLIDRWRTGAAESRATLPLLAGARYDIRLEYFENTGSAYAQLGWSSDSTPRQLIPQALLYSRAAPVTPAPTPIPTPTPTSVPIPTPTPAIASAPSISIDAPVAQYSYFAVSSVTGRAVDADGDLQSVNTLLYRYNDNSYWNGAAWVAIPSEIALQSTLNALATWNWTLPALSDGQYSVQAVARDKSGLTTWTPWIPFWIDNAPPTTSIIAPLADGIYDSVRGSSCASGSSGTATDIGPGVAQVTGRLQRGSDGAFWNGSAWVTGSSDLVAQGRDSWTVAFPALSSGSYNFAIAARDYIGNLSPANAVSFRIDAASSNVVARRTATPIAPSALSVAETSSSLNLIRLRFAPPLHPAFARAVPRYQVWVNGVAVRVESADYRVATNTVTLVLPAKSLRRGARVAVAWKSLRALNQSTLPDGSWTGVTQ